MPRGPLNSLVRHIRKLAGPPAGAGPSDAALLQRFVSDSDEAAFAEIVGRHGRLVLSVCRRLLPREEDVEDAFQATLLVLARKASAIRNRRSVASWLYGVAYRTALKTRTTIARREKYEQRAEVRSLLGPVSEAAMRELQAILDDEVRRLPEKFRAPFVLCCLEGKSKGEAGQELGWPEGTVSGRVAQARKLLQRRLARRGIALSAALCALAVAEGTATAGGPVLTTAGLLAGAVAFATSRLPTAGAVSARAIVIAEAVLQADAAFRTKMVLAVALLLGLAGGAGAWWHGARDRPPPEVAAVDPDDKPVAAAPAPGAGAAVGAAAPDRDAAGDVLFSGQVLDADRRPRAGAGVALIALPSVPIEDRARASAQARVLTETQADADGRFRLTVPPAVAANHVRLTLVAADPGAGPGWQLLLEGTPRENVELRLARRDHRLRGRLVDARGQPAAGVTLRLGELSGTLLLPETGAGDTLRTPVVSDAAGQFVIQGVLPGCQMQVRVQDDRFAPQCLQLTTKDGDETDAGDVRVAPRRTLKGTVVCRETGRPLAGVALAVTGPLNGRVETVTDAEGTFQLHPFPYEGVSLLAYPPAGAPYMLGTHFVDWRDDEDRSVRVTLQRGVLLQGHVTEASSGQPVGGAVVSYRPIVTRNKILLSRRNGETNVNWTMATTVTDANGGFRIVGLPGSGHLLVRGPGPGYLHVETTSEYLGVGKPGGHPTYADALVPLELEPGTGPIDLPIELRRGLTVTGHLVGADGEPAHRAAVVCPSYLLDESVEYMGTMLLAADGRFEVPGCDPYRAVPMLFYDPDRRQGARVEVRGGTEPTVRLVPCRSAAVRFLDDNGKPAVGTKIALDVVVHPRGVPADVNAYELHLGYAVEVAKLAGPSHVTAGSRPGEVKFSGLIPGATYLIEADEGRGLVVKQAFTVKADEDPRLHDVVVRAPPAKPSPR
jgi:RNA polymerase sigma factor (sigma-70 family)